MEAMGSEAQKVREEAEKALQGAYVKLEQKRQEMLIAERARLEEEAKQREEQEWLETIARVAFDDVASVERKVQEAADLSAPILGEKLTSDEINEKTTLAEEAIAAAEAAIKM